MKGQYPVYYQKTLLDNYPVTTVNTDDNGRIWLGTNAGLYLYDGKKTSSPISELNNTRILNTFLDEKNDNLWIYARNLFGVLNLKTFTFKILKRYIDFDPYISPSICILNNDIYTMFMDGKINGYDKEGHLIKSIYISDFGLNKNTPLLTAYKKNLIVLVNNKRPQLFQIQIKDNKIIKSIYLPNKDARFLGVTQIGEYNGNLLCTAYDHGYFLFDIEHNSTVADQEISALNKLNGSPYLFYLSKNKCLYLTYKNGSIFRFKDNPHHFLTVLDKKLNFPIYFSHNAISINNGFLLVGDKTGLELIAQKKIQFSSILTQQNISTRNIISDGSDGMFIASYSGIYHYNTKNNRINAYDYFYTTWPLKRKVHNFASYSLWTEKTNPYVYIGSEGFPFFRFSKKSKLFETEFYKHPDFDSFGIENVYSFVKIKNQQKLLIGYQHGLAIFNMETDEFSLLKNSYFNKSDIQILKIIQAKDNRFIICTKYGLYKYDFNTVIKYTQIGNIQVNDCIEDERNRLWISTEYNGLYILDKNGKIINHLTTNNGLPSNEIASILIDPQKQIWITTQNGLVKINPTNFDLYRFQMDEGLSTNEFNKASIYGDNSHLYFGSINGVNIYSLSTHNSSKNSSIKINYNYIEIWREKNKSIEYFYQNNFSKNSPIKIYPGDRIMNMSFGLSDVKDIDNNQYEYRIEKIDNHWHKFDYQEKLNFFKLNYGKYTIEIRGYNAYHVLSQNTISITVDMLRPFYLSWWFIISIIFLLFVLVLTYYKIKLTNYKKLQLQRVLIASNLHDDIGGLLSAIQLELENYKIKFGNEQNIERLQRIEKLSKNASNAVYESLWMIDSRNDSIDNLLDKFYEATDLILLPINIKPEYSIAIDNFEENIDPQIRQQLFYIFKESLNNIVKHARPSKLLISINKISSGLQIEIRNNGVIHPDTQRLTGMGLNNMNKRAEQIKYFFRFQIEKDWAVVLIKPA